MTKNRGVVPQYRFVSKGKFVMKKVISFVVAIALVLSMSVCAFAAEVPAADADYDAWVSYYTEVLTDATLDDDAKIDTVVANMPASKALFYATLDKAVADVITDGTEAEAVLNAVNDDLILAYGWGLDEAEWEYEVEENLDINIDGYIGNPADGNVAPNLPGEEPGLEEDTEDDSDSAGSFLDTILGVLGGLGDILFGEGGEGTDEPTTDENNDPWGEEEPSTQAGNNGSQSPNTGDTSVVAVATVALVAGAALVLTRKKSEDAE